MSTLLIIFAYFFGFLLTCSNCFNPTLLNESKVDRSYDSGWSLAGATWYGNAKGFGSDGGACGYGNAVGRPPFSAMVSAAGPSIYQSSHGCGICYMVKCSTNIQACSGRPITVTVTDECPGCTNEANHFDLSGTAFGAMAKPGFADQLRNLGIIQLQFRRVDCNYRGVTVVVRVDVGSNQYYLAAAIEYTNGDGLKTVELQEQGSGAWAFMEQSWGALWKFKTGNILRPPFSFRLTSGSGKTIVLQNVIPKGWLPGQTYRSHVNF